MRQNAKTGQGTQEANPRLSSLEEEKHEDIKKGSNTWSLSCLGLQFDYRLTVNDIKLAYFVLCIVVAS